MKKTVLLLIITINCLTTFVAKGQTGKMTFTYSYDDAGNRIKRKWTLVACPGCRIAKADSTKVLDSLFTIAQDLEIKLPETPTEKLLYDGSVELKNIYPNPTKGNFLVQFTNLLLQGNLQIFDMKGNKFDELTLNGTEFQLDISLLPAGEYTIVIRTKDGKVYNKKIVKI